VKINESDLRPYSNTAQAGATEVQRPPRALPPQSTGADVASVDATAFASKGPSPYLSTRQRVSVLSSGILTLDISTAT